MVQYMSRRGVDSNPWNVPEEELREWSLRFSGILPNSVQANNLQNAHNDVDDDMTSNSSEETTMLLDDDNSSTIQSGLSDMDMTTDNDECIQHGNISSSTPTLKTLNIINSMQKNVWILQPALNSIYHTMDPVPTCHYKNSTGAYQMAFTKPYDNALMSPLMENVCMIKRRDFCPMASIQSHLFHLMIAMQTYDTKKPAEKKSLISNFNYLAHLVSSMEQGLRAQREWSTIIQSLRHHSYHFPSSSANLETIDLPRMVKIATNKCPDLSMNDQTPLTTLFDQFQKQSFGCSSSSSSSSVNESTRDLSDKEITAYKMFELMVTIEKMSNEIINNNITFS